MHQVITLFAAAYLLAGILFVRRSWKHIRALPGRRASPMKQVSVVFLWRLLVRPAHWLATKTGMLLLSRVALWLEAPIKQVTRLK